MGPMRACLSAVLALGLLLSMSEARAFCVYNYVPGGNVHAALVVMGAQGSKIYAESVAPGKESCCNPKNFQCNPFGLPETASIAFAARIEALAGRPQMPCGKLTADRQGFPSGLEVFVPLRGSLQFEVNPLFVSGRAAGMENPPFVAKALSPEKLQVAMYPCAPKG